MSNDKSIIFGYSSAPSFGCFGASDGGFSIELYSDGSFIYKTFIFDMNEKQKRKMSLSMETVKKLKEVLLMYYDRITEIPNRLDNGSLDGSRNTFILLGKEISDYNISITDEEILKKQNPAYFKKYETVIKQENLIMKIFNLVVKELQYTGINLTLHNVDFDEELQWENS